MRDDDQYRRSELSAAIICGSVTRRAQLQRLAAGYRILSATDLDSLGMTPDVLLVELSSISDASQDVLARLEHYCDDHRCITVIWTDMNGLEAVYAALPRAHFIVDGADDEAAALLSRHAADNSSSMVKEERKDADFVALHRISDELAGVARKLADMAEHARPPAPSLTLVAPMTEPEPSSQPVTAADIRVMIRRRRQREQYFGGEMLADPGWDILLDLFAAGLEEKDVSVSSLCIAAAVPPTTALRWIGAMTEAGMLVRRFDPRDGRRVFISLSDDATVRMQQYFAALGGGAAVI